jgi:hypothetical protein
MSSTAISHDTLQKTVQQPASATDTLVERHLGLVVASPLRHEVTDIVLAYRIGYHSSQRPHR